MSDLIFRNFGNGVIIEDGSKKGFGAIKPRTKNRVGDKYTLKLTTGYIPLTILDNKQIRDAKKLGFLIATWEHRVFITSVMLQINPFDQFVVNAGKIYTKKYLDNKD